MSAKCQSFAFALGQTFNIHILQRTWATTEKLNVQNYDFTNDRIHHTSLMKYAVRGELAGLRVLKSIGVDLGSTNYDRRSAAHLAARNGHLMVLRFLESAGVNLEAQDAAGNRPLDDATEMGHEDVVHFLCAKTKEVRNPPRRRPSKDLIAGC
jgi:ankyrin repeat protein